MTSIRGENINTLSTKCQTLKQNKRKNLKHFPKLSNKEIRKRLLSLRKSTDLRILDLLINKIYKDGFKNGRYWQYKLFVTQTYIAKELGLQRETVNRSLRRIEEARLLKIINRGRDWKRGGYKSKTCFYYVHPKILDRKCRIYFEEILPSLKLFLRAVTHVRNIIYLSLRSNTSRYSLRKLYLYTSELCLEKKYYYVYNQEEESYSYEYPVKMKNTDDNSKKREIEKINELRKAKGLKIMEESPHKIEDVQEAINYMSELIGLTEVGRALLTIFDIVALRDAFKKLKHAIDTNKLYGENLNCAKFSLVYRYAKENMQNRGYLVNRDRFLELCEKRGLNPTDKCYKDADKYVFIRPRHGVYAIYENKKITIDVKKELEKYKISEENDLDLQKKRALFGNSLDIFKNRIVENIKKRECTNG